MEADLLTIIQNDLTWINFVVCTCFALSLVSTVVIGVKLHKLRKEVDYVFDYMTRIMREIKNR